MEQPTIGGEPSVEPAGARVRVTTDTGSIKIKTSAGGWSMAQSAWAPGLIHWGGFAAILGGVSWIFVVLFLEWQTLRRPLEEMHYLFPPALDYYSVYRHINSHFLAAPMVFFSLGILGLYALQFGRRGWLGHVGFVFSVGGLFLAIMATMKPSAYLDEVPSVAIDPVLWWPIAWWYNTASSGLAVISLGLVLLGIAAIRANALPGWNVLLLMIAALAIYIVPVLSRAVSFAGDTLLFEYGLFAGLLVLFGVSWMLLGYSLWRVGPEVPAQSRLTRTED